MSPMCDYIVHLYYSLWNRRVVALSIGGYIVLVCYSLWNWRVAMLYMYITGYGTGEWQCYPCVTILYMYM